MNTLVVYATRSGNTRHVADAIAEALRPRGSVDVMAAEDAPTVLPPVDLLFVGGPTEGHRVTKPVVEFLEHLAPGSLRGVAAAAFDTRIDWPRLLSGSAAAEISKRLAAAGAAVIEPEGSFLVTKKPLLEPGEAARAAAWAATVATVAAERMAAPANR